MSRLANLAQTRLAVLDGLLAGPDEAGDCYLGLLAERSSLIEELAAIELGNEIAKAKSDLAEQERKDKATQRKEAMKVGRAAAKAEAKAKAKKKAKNAAAWVRQQRYREIRKAVAGKELFNEWRAAEQRVTRMNRQKKKDEAAAR